MKLNDWEILHCVRRLRKSTIGEKGRETRNRSVDIVPIDTARTTVQRWRKVLERKTEKDH